VVELMEITIEFLDEGLTVNMSVLSLGNNRYQLNEGLPLIESTTIYDIVEVEPLPDGSLSFRKVVKESGWQTYSFTVSKMTTESDSLRAILNKVEQNNGQWEQILGGFLFIYLPPNSAYDPTSDIETLSN